MRSILLFLFLSFSTQSQVVVGGFQIFKHSYRENKPEDIESLKKTKTIFVLTPGYSIEEYTKAISEVWDINPFEVIWYTTYNSMSENERNEKYKIEEASMVKFNSFVYKLNATDFQFNSLDFKTYNLKKNYNNGKFTYVNKRIATILFTPNIKQRDESRSSKEIDPDWFINYDLGHLKIYLKIINNKLKKNEYLSCFDEYSKKEALSNLKTKKLYISESVLEKYNSGSRTEGEDIEVDELLMDYKFPYEVVSISKLNEMLLNNEEIYFLDYNQINADKFISIIDAKRGEYIYNEFTSLSYNIKPKDFKAISKAIEK